MSLLPSRWRSRTEPHRTRVKVASTVEPYTRMTLPYRWDCTNPTCGHHGLGFDLSRIHDAAWEHTAKHHPPKETT